MARYSRDPYWMTTRYAGECAGCDKKIPKGARAYYYPNGRRIFCEGCGNAKSAEFESQRWDEDNNTCL